MAAIMLTTGLVFDLGPGTTRDQVIQQLASASGIATGPINGVTTTIRAAAVAAVSDNPAGLTTTYVAPITVVRQGGDPTPGAPQ